MKLIVLLCLLALACGPTPEPGQRVYELKPPAENKTLPEFRRALILLEAYALEKGSSVCENLTSYLSARGLRLKYDRDRGGDFDSEFEVELLEAQESFVKAYVEGSYQKMVLAEPLGCLEYEEDSLRQWIVEVVLNEYLFHNHKFDRMGVVEQALQRAYKRDDALRAQNKS